MADSPRRLVVAFRQDRTIARLKNVVSAWEFARRIEAPFRLVWTNYDYLVDRDLALFDMFDEAKMRAIEPKIDFEFMSRQDFYASDYFEKPDPEKESRALSEWRALDFEHYYFRQTRVYVFPDLTVPPLERLAARRELFFSLPLHSDIQRALDATLAKFDLSNCIAVHLRRGDPLHGAWGIKLAGIGFEEEDAAPRMSKAFFPFAHRYAPNKAYFSAIDQFDPTQSIAVFSDDIEVRTAFEAAYPDRVIAVHDVLDGFDLTQTQRDYLEFQLMLRAQRLIGHKSAYATFAAEMGEIPMLNVAALVSCEDVVADLTEFIQDRPDRDFAMRHYLGCYVTYYDRYGPKSIADDFRGVLADLGGVSTV
ncbi:MAG: hypothetical protein AAGP08_02035 [Pseudomonadota bacterium]